jgi:hypothetical protein
MTIRDFHHAANSFRRSVSAPSVVVRTSGTTLMDKPTIEERMRVAKERAQRWKGEAERLEGIKRSRERKEETRRKIWAGGWLLREIASDAALRARLVAHLQSAKLRRGERELFADLINDK